MPRNITVSFDDGSTHVYQNAPDDITPEMVTERASKDFGKVVASLDGGRGAGAAIEPQPEPIAPQPEPIAPKEPRLKLPPEDTTIRDTARSLLQGATLGFSDEIGTGLAATAATGVGNVKNALGMQESNPELGDVYSEMQKQVSGEQKQFREDRPGLALATELVGGIAPAIVTGGGALAAKTLGQAALQGAKQGAIYGGIYGAGTAEQGERLKGAGIGAATGAVGGAVLTPAIQLTGKAIGAVAQNVADRFFKSNAEKAVQYMQNVAASTGRSIDDIATEMESLGPQAILPDVDRNFAVAAKTAANQFGPTKQAARELVDSRQLGQHGETLRTLSKELGDIGGADVFNALDQNAKQMTEKAAPLYDAALKQGVPRSEAMQKLEALPVYQKAYKMAGKYAANDLNRVTKQGDSLMGGSFKAGELSEAEKLHYAKQALFDMESAQARAGNKNAARQIAETRRALTNELDSLPGYKEARQIWSSGSEAAEAAQIGKDFFKMDAYEFDQAVKGMNAYDKEMAKMGMMNAIQKQIERAKDNRSMAGILTDNEEARRKVRAVVGEEGLNALAENAKKWGAFTETRNIVKGGSPTSEFETAQAQTGRMLADMALNPKEAVKNAIYNVLVPNSRITPEIAEESGKLLFKQGMTREEIVNMLTPQVKKNSISKGASIAPVPAASVVAQYK